MDQGQTRRIGNQERDKRMMVLRDQIAHLRQEQSALAAGDDAKRAEVEKRIDVLRRELHQLLQTTDKLRD